MIILLSGSSFSGKTFLSQKLLEKCHYPYLSIDHLKMGLLRSGTCDFRIEDDISIQENVWPIVREMIKTAIENKQNLIVEGCYIPFTYKDDFTSEYLEYIRYYCLVLSENYIRDYYTTIQENANCIENRMDLSLCDPIFLMEENKRYLTMCKKYNCAYLLINKNYDVELLVNEIVSITGMVIKDEINKQSE